MNLLRRVALSAMMAGLAGCAVLPPLGTKREQGDLARVKEGVPSEWAALPSSSPGEPAGWLDEFSGSELRPLVEQALQENRDFKAAAARVRAAQAQTASATAALLPTAGLDGLANRSQRPGDQRFASIGQRAKRFTVTGQYAWELDLWGRVADQRRAAKARERAAAADYHGARLSLAATTARTAITLAEASSLRDLSAENVRVRKTQLGILERQLDRGVEPARAALDLSLGRADLARAESVLAQRGQVVDETRRTLETLMGGYPAGKERGLSELPTLRRAVPAGLPTELLLRRPDILVAEQRLREATSNESVAKKAFLPSIRLTGNRGFSSQQLATLANPSTALWTIGGDAALSLFEGGSRLAEIRRRKAGYDEALMNYESQALTAFREVETALAAGGFFAEQEAALRSAVEEADRAERLALGQYEKGLADVLTLLDARQRAFDSRGSLISVQADRLRNRLDLHLALGGDF